VSRSRVTLTLTVLEAEALRLLAEPVVCDHPTVIGFPWPSPAHGAAARRGYEKRLAAINRALEAEG
jgi:hypothetical protein